MGNMYESGNKGCGVQVEYEMGQVINSNRSSEQKAWALHCTFRGFLERALTVGLVTGWLRHEPQKVSIFVKLKCPTAWCIEGEGIQRLGDWNVKKGFVTYDLFTCCWRVLWTWLSFP